MEINKRGLVPFIEKHHSDGKYKFWSNLASSYYAKLVVDYFRVKKINFVQKLENPANVTETRPIEDFWYILKGNVYENGWKSKNSKNYKTKYAYV